MGFNLINEFMKIKLTSFDLIYKMTKGPNQLQWSSDTNYVASIILWDITPSRESILNIFYVTIASDGSNVMS